MQSRKVAHKVPHGHPHFHSSILYRPDKSYFYFPKKEEEQHKDKRFFFYGQTEFTEKQKKYLQEYKKYMVTKKLTHPPTVTDQKIVLFLHQKNFKVEDAYKALKEDEDWRQINIPVDYTPEIQQMLETGIIYMSGRDNRYRPIIIMNLKFFDEKKTELIIRTFTYFFEQIIEHVLLPGQVEQWVTIMDVEGFSLFSLPLGGGKKLLNHLETHYRGRLYRLYMVNSPSTLWLSWKIVKQFLQDSTVQKVDIVSGNDIKKLYQHTHRSQLEKRFGGTQQNRKSFWPGERALQQFFLPTDQHDKLHLPKEHYGELSKKLPNNIIHPDFVAGEKKEQPIVSKPEEKDVEVQSIPSVPIISVQPPSEKSIPADETSIKEQKVEVKPIEQKPAEVKPIEQKPAEVKPPQVQHKPVTVESAQALPPQSMSSQKLDKVDNQQDLKSGKGSTGTIVEPPQEVKPHDESEHHKEEKVDNQAKNEAKQEQHEQKKEEHKEQKHEEKSVPSSEPHTDTHQETHAEKPAESTGFVVPPPEPLPPVTGPNVKHDKIIGQGIDQ